MNTENEIHQINQIDPFFIFDNWYGDILQQEYKNDKEIFEMNMMLSDLI